MCFALWGIAEACEPGRSREWTGQIPRKKVV